MTLQDAWKKVQQQGPTTFLIAPGTTMIWPLAKRDGKVCDAIFIRDDGWSMGCDFYSVQHAEHMFDDGERKWIGVVYRGQKEPRVIAPPPAATGQ